MMSCKLAEASIENPITKDVKRGCSMIKAGSDPL